MKKNIMVLGLISLLGSISLFGCGGDGGNNGGDNGGNTCTEVKEDNNVHLIILAGQSGGRGKALNSDLTDEQKAVNYDVDIIADGLMMPELTHIPDTPAATSALKEVKPGFGDSGSENGPEIGMSETLRSRYAKDGLQRKSVIIKYTACGSTFTSDWYSTSLMNEAANISGKLNLKQVKTNPTTLEKTGPLTNNLYQLIDMAKDQLEGEGFTVKFDGAAFVHGEQDAKFDDNMDIYETALKDWMKDLRSYVGDEKLPIVVTEALTNSAKYSNKLRDIQKKVTDADQYSTLVETLDLKTNTFEPWHFGAQSNIILGNRIAAELVSLNDIRKITAFKDSSITVSKGTKIALPKYQIAEFDNETEGYVKVDSYDDYDASKVGTQKIKYKVKLNCTEYTGEINVNVAEVPYVDGVLNESIYTKKTTVDNTDVYVKKSDEGIYVGFKIKDNDVWTDGEQWSIGDMGQRKKNDDFRIYVTNSTANQRYTAAISSASLLRIYNSGTSINEDSDTNIIKNNLVYTKAIESSQGRVTTYGDVNGGTNTGFDGEVFLSYVDLSMDPTDNIKIMFEYSDISSTDEGKTKTEDKKYLKKTGTATSLFEKDDACYYSLDELI